MCNCIENIKTEISKSKNAISVEIEGVYPIEHSNIGFIPTINVSFRLKNKNGTLRKSRTKSYIIASYCPFCGKKYKE